MNWDFLYLIIIFELIGSCLISIVWWVVRFVFFVIKWGIVAIIFVFITWCWYGVNVFWWGMTFRLDIWLIMIIKHWMIWVDWFSSSFKIVFFWGWFNTLVIFYPFTIVITSFGWSFAVGFSFFIIILLFIIIIIVV